MPSPSATAEPPRPEPPTQQDCCGGDCAPNCVFDIYERELERWQQTCDALRATNRR